MSVGEAGRALAAAGMAGDCGLTIECLCAERESAERSMHAWVEACLILKLDKTAPPGFPSSILLLKLAGGCLQQRLASEELLEAAGSALQLPWD